jgi:hypothetical protein
MELKTTKYLDGWIKKGGATPDRSRTPARRPLFGLNVLLYGRSEKRNKTEKDTKETQKIQKT